MQVYAEKFNLVSSSICSLQNSLISFFDAFMQMFLYFLGHTIYSRFCWWKSKFLMLPRRAGHWDAQRTIRRPHQHKPLYQIASVFLAILLLHSFFFQIIPHWGPGSPHGGLLLIRAKQKECHRSRLSGAFEGATVKTASFGYLCLPKTMWQFGGIQSHGVHPGAAAVQQVSSKHGADQLQLVLNSVRKPDLRFCANPFSSF